MCSGMSVTKEEERDFSRRLDAYVKSRDFILGRWRAASTEYLTKQCLDEVPEEERPLYREAYDFLLAHGAINFGSVQPLESEPEEKPLSERDIVLALYEILRTVDFQTATEKAIRKQLAEKLGMPMEGHKRLINKHVNYVVENLNDRGTLQPLGFGEGEQQEEGARRPQNVVVVGAGASGLAAASTLKKCGVEVTVLEARNTPGGRCIASLSSSSSSNGKVAGDGGGNGSDGSLGKRGPWHLGELAPLPLMLHPKGMLADDESGLGSRRAAVELMEVLGHQQGLDVKGNQKYGESGELPVIDPATGKSLPLERLCAASQLLQEILLTCQFAAHQPSLRAAIDEALQQRLDKAGADIAAAASAADAAAAATTQAAAATVAVAEAASYDDIAAAAAAREGERGGDEKQAEDGTDGPKEDHEQRPQEQQQQEQQQEQQQQRAKQLERQQEEQQEKETQQQQAQQALAEAHTAQQELQDAARALTWQLCAFETYAGLSLCVLLPSAAVHLSAALVPTGMAPGSPSAFASLFPVGGHPKPTSLPPMADTAVAQGTAERRTAAAKLQRSIIQGLGHQHLDIRFGDPVVSVAYGTDGATVRTQSGAELKAGIAILAVPLGVLQAGAITLDPPLPLWKTDAHACLGVSSSVCIALEYEAPFWRQHNSTQAGKLFGVLPQSLPPPAPPCDELAGEGAAAAAAEVAAAAEAGAGESTSSLGWVFEEVSGEGEGSVVVLAHVLAAPGAQASRLPDSALQHAAMTALNSTAPAEANNGSGHDAGAANGDGSTANTEKGNVDAEGVDADFSDFAHFEQIVAGEPAPGAGAERKVSTGPPPLRASVLRWDGANSASRCRACALPGARTCGLVGEDEDENLLLAAAAAPLQAALLFAGEHTVQAGLVGTVPGALLSGVREAARAHKLLLQLRIGGEVVDQEVLDETELDTGKLKADARQRDKERQQAVKQKKKEEAKAAKAEENKAKKAAATEAKKRKKEEQEDGDALPDDESETSDSESETDVEREVKKPRKRRQKGEGKKGKGKRGRSPGGGSEGEKPGEEGEEEEEEGKKGKKAKRGRKGEKGEKGPSTRRKKSPSKEPEADMFLDPIRYEEQQAKRGELRNFLKSVHKAMINASKDNVQPIWEIIEASESIDNRSQLINMMLHADQDALKFMGGDDPILRILAVWVQDLAQEASTEHLLLSLFKIFERMPSRLNNVRDSGLLAAVKKLRGNDARKETRAGANELWGVWDKRFKEHNRQAALAAAQAAAKASMAIDPLLGLDSIKQAHQQPFGGTLLPHQLLQPQPMQQQQQLQDGQQQQQQQQQNGQQDVPMEGAKPRGVSVEQLDEEDRARIQALEAKLAEDERLAQEAEQRRLQEQQQPGPSSAPRLPRIPTFDEYSKKQNSKKERTRAKKEGAQGGSVPREDTAPAGTHQAPPEAAPAGPSSGSAAVPSPLYNIVTKMLTSAVNKGELQKERFKVMREKVIAKIASGKAEAEVHSEPYVRSNMDKIKRLVKSYIEAKQAKGKDGS